MLLYKSGEYNPNLLLWKNFDTTSVLNPRKSGLCCHVVVDNGDEVILYVLHNRASEWPRVAALAHLQNTLFYNSFLLFSLPNSLSSLTHSK